MTINQYNKYIEMIESGMDTTQGIRVLRSVRSGRSTLSTIQKDLSPIKLSSVSGRVSELLDQGMIEESRPGQFVPVMSPERAEMLSLRRKDARYRKWLKQGDDNGWFAMMSKEYFDR